ncbi:MAG: Flp pilus assembly protein CpaB [Rhodobacteraceae bacterium]|nr:Flp pilus assembly protein CpaB [Paracoccaceae bacterium]
MRLVFGLVLIVGIALAGASVLMARNYIAQHQAQLEMERQARGAVVPTVEVLVAQRALKYGEPLRREDVGRVQWPEAAVPEGAFIDVEALFPPDETDRRVILRAMERGEAILAVKVSKPGEDAGITSRLERGMRAFAIKVDVASGVSGFLRPGDKVDVYWTGSADRISEVARGEFTQLIEAGVKLIAIDQTTGDDMDEAVIARTVTVSARPEQVAALAQAQSTGRLSLALVGADDDTVSAAIEVDQRSLLGLAAAEVRIEQAKEKVCTVRTRRGAEVVEIPIPCTN